MVRNYRRRRRPLHWSLGQLFLLMTGMAVVLAGAQPLYQGLGPDQFFALFSQCLGAGLYLMALRSVSLLAEWLVVDGPRRIVIGDCLLFCLAAPILPLALLAYEAWEMLPLWLLLVGSLVPVWHYYTWREDQVSPVLDRLERWRAMQPTVAILGASADRSKFGNKSVRAHVKRGYDVYPVNPKGGEIEGLRVYASLAEIPVPLTRISVYLPPAIGLKALDEIAAKGCEELYLNPGSDAPEVVERARELGLDPIVACSIVAIGEVPD